MSTRNTSAIAVALFLFSSVLPLSASAGGRRRVLTVSPASPAPAITFLGTSGMVDAGTIASNGKRSARSTRIVTLRIGEASSEPRGTATLRAFLETPDPRATIRIDGITLTTAPRVIARHAPVGVAITHRIEIEVPVTAAEGPLQASIGWEATTE